MLAFISYAREDGEAAKRLYTDLKAGGVEPWLDKRDLRPGERWKHAIEDAISRSRYFVALLSSHSVNKRGYVQKELRQALDVLDEFPDSEIFLIPARLDDCKPSNHKLKDPNWVDLFPEWNRGVRSILRSMRLEKCHLTGQSTLELLKRIYLEADGNEAQMLDAIRGAQNLINEDTLDITDEEWAYVMDTCPERIVELLKSTTTKSSKAKKAKVKGKKSK